MPRGFPTRIEDSLSCFPRIIYMAIHPSTEVRTCLSFLIWNHFSTTTLLSDTTTMKLHRRHIRSVRHIRRHFIDTLKVEADRINSEHKRHETQKTACDTSTSKVKLLTSSTFFCSSKSSWQYVRHSAWYEAANSLIRAFLLIMPITSRGTETRLYNKTVIVAKLDNRQKHVILHTLVSPKL